MKIFVVNAGSSSLKCALYEFSKMPKKNVGAIWEAHWDKDKTTTLTLKVSGKKVEETSCSELKSAFKQILHALVEGKSKILSSLDEIDIVGHRIVHGGKKYTKSARVTKEVKKQIRALADVAPLHNLISLECIEMMEKFVKRPQVAVFDTSFHHTMPPEAYIYPGPYEWVKKGIQRYGFHGMSFQYCAARAAEMLKKRPSKMVICHLGAGSSLAAIKDGKSIDTTMGFTPLEGLMMDTRSGTVDPGIIFYLLKKKSREAVERELYEKSGLLGITGKYSDMRDVEKAAGKDRRAKLSLDIYIHRLNGLIGSMIASLEGIDTLVFTGGIGENSSLIRKRVCDAFSFLGLKIKQERKGSKEDHDLSDRGSKVKILVLHTQENFEIAKECYKLHFQSRISGIS